MKTGAKPPASTAGAPTSTRQTPTNLEKKIVQPVLDALESRHPGLDRTKLAPPARILIQALGSDAPDVKLARTALANAIGDIIEVAQKDAGTETHQVGKVSSHTLEWLVTNQDQRTISLLKRIAALDTVDLKLDQTLAQELFDNAMGALRDGVGDKTFWKIVNDAAAGDEDKLSGKQLKQLRAVKAAGDQVRAAFRLLDESHTVPIEVHRFVRDLGRLKDAGENGLNPKKAAKKVKARFDDLDLDQVDKRFEPAKKKKLRKRTAQVVNSIRQEVGESKLDAPSFHLVRKRIRDLLDLMRLLDDESDGADLSDAKKTFRAMNRVLGEVHDQLVAHALGGDYKYDKLKVVVPSEMVFLVQQMVEKIDV